MAQHADTVWNVFRGLTEHVFRGNRIGADNFVRSDSDANVFMPAIAAQGSNDNVLGMQAVTTAFCNRNVNQRNYCATQIEDAHHVTRAERKLGHDWPFQ